MPCNYQRYKKEGRCGSCGVPNTNGFVMCDACRTRTNANNKAWKKANPDKLREYQARSDKKRTPEYKRHYQYKRAYGITLEAYNALHEKQNGLCAICARPERERKVLSLDHDHDTGEIRGLLCSNCNKGLGFFDDNAALVRAAHEYLSKRPENNSNGIVSGRFAPPPNQR